jgi:hypothetical protein
MVEHFTGQKWASGLHAHYLRRYSDVLRSSLANILAFNRRSSLSMLRAHFLVGQKRNTIIARIAVCVSPVYFSSTRAVSSAAY